jgi:hypothetical protein
MLDRGADPGEDAGKKSEGGGRERGEHDASAEPAPAPDRKGQQQLQPLIGLFATRGRDLRAREEAQ